MLSHLDIENSGTGSAALLLTPDSQRLIMGLSDSSQILVVELPPDVVGDAGAVTGLRVMKCFKRAEVLLSGRVIIAGRKRSRMASGLANGHRGLVNGSLKEANGHLDEAYQDEGYGRVKRRARDMPKVNGQVKRTDQWRSTKWSRPASIPRDER